MEEVGGVILSGGWPSLLALSCTEGGTGERQRRSPMRWSSQMLVLKKSMPGAWEGWDEVRALR